MMPIRQANQSKSTAGLNVRPRREHLSERSKWPNSDEAVPLVSIQLVAVASEPPRRVLRARTESLLRSKRSDCPNLRSAPGPRISDHRDARTTVRGVAIASVGRPSVRGQSCRSGAPARDGGPVVLARDYVPHLMGDTGRARSRHDDGLGPSRPIGSGTSWGRGAVSCEAEAVATSWRDQVRGELRAAGVPRWAWTSSSDDPQSAARYYAWVEEGAVHSRLLMAEGADRSEATRELIRSCNEFEADEGPFPAVDFDQPSSLLVIRPTGVGHGPLGRPAGDLMPLRELLQRARQELLSQLGAD